MRDLQAARGASLSSDEPGPEQHADPVPAPDSAPGRRRLLLLLSVAAVALVLDVVTKVLVVARLEGEQPVELLGGQLLLRVSRNPGAAFSFAEGATVLFTTVAVVVIVVILRVSRRLYSAGWALALGLLLGGAIGNLLDRIFREPGFPEGHVVDFLDLPQLFVFNVADAAITCAAVLIALMGLRGTGVDGSRVGA